MDPEHRLVSGPAAAALRPARRVVEPSPGARARRARRPARPAAPRAPALRLPRCLPSPRDDRSLHDAGRGSVDAPMAGAPARWRPSLHPPFAFLRNYVLRRGFPDGARRPAGLGAELVLRVPQAGEAVGAAAADRRPVPSAAPQQDARLTVRRPPVRQGRSLDALTRCSRSTSTRRAPGGAARTRCSSPSWGCARWAIARPWSHIPSGELRERAKEGLDLIPLAPANEMDLSAAWRLSRLHQAAQAGHRARPRSARRGDGGARAVDEHPAGEAAADRRAPGRLPSARRLAFALEVPPGRLLHLRLGGHPPDADLRRRARRRAPSS